MKRYGNLINKIAEPDNIQLAFWKASKGKRAKREVILFRDKLEMNISSLREQILIGKPDVGHYTFFRIYDPKERVICAASFPERVLHHAIMNICEPIFESYAIYNSYACRVEKGSHKAVKKAQSFSRDFSCFLKLDIKKYFDSIDHKILLKMLKHRFKDKVLLRIFEIIIESYSKNVGKGVPIGNLLSQHWANFYFGLFDHWIKEEKGIKGYIRYMDDFIIFSNNKQELNALLIEIDSFLNNELELKLKENIQLNYCKHGIPFLGYRVFPGTIRLLRQSKQRFIKKLRQYEYKFKYGIWDELTLQKHVQPLVEFVKFADTLNFRKKFVI